MELMAGIFPQKATPDPKENDSDTIQVQDIINEFKNIFNFK